MAAEPITRDYRVTSPSVEQISLALQGEVDLVLLVYMEPSLYGGQPPTPIGGKVLNHGFGGLTGDTLCVKMLVEDGIIAEAKIDPARCTGCISFPATP